MFNNVNIESLILTLKGIEMLVRCILTSEAKHYEKEVKAIL
jgi:hypothetical protein